MNTEQVFTVKELTREIKSALENHPVLQQVSLRGEISNFTHHSRGHMYFTLKDESARIRAVMFAGHNRYLKFLPSNGMKVVVRGEISVYERDGQYQFYVKQMQPDGIGALYQAYEDLKKKLQLQGWFDPEHKQELPKFPRKIGVITSPTGAAIRDIISTLKRRFPIVEIIVLPVLVQGEQAPASVARAIGEAHRQKGIDLLIVGRGGGSIEELWAFNDPLVAEAIFKATIPIISAVGHETDYTIADFVADLRAPTPTAAAELSVPVLSELEDRVALLKKRLHQALLRDTAEQRKALNRLKQSYAFRYPFHLISQKEQEFDQSWQRLQRAAIQQMERAKQELNHLLRRLDRLHPQANLQQAKEHFRSIDQDLRRAMQLLLKEKKQAFGQQLATLDALSPLKIMTKGYSLLYAAEEQRSLLQSARQIEPGQAIRVVMHDGELDCQVWGIREGKPNE